MSEMHIPQPVDKKVVEMEVEEETPVSLQCRVCTPSPRKSLSLRLRKKRFVLLEFVTRDS